MRKIINNVSLAIFIFIVLIILFIIFAFVCNAVNNRIQHGYVEELQGKVPSVISFVNENQEMLSILLSLQTRVNEINESNTKNNQMTIKRLKLYPVYNEEDSFAIEIDYKSPQRIDEFESKEIESSLFTKDEKAGINLADNLLSIYIYSDGISILYAEIEEATLRIIHPTIVLPNSDDEYYSRNWYIKIIDNNWYIEILNLR
jgi:hypothetical protein